jgi:hypothetical protein
MRINGGGTTQITWVRVGLFQIFVVLFVRIISACGPYDIVMYNG